MRILQYALSVRSLVAPHRPPLASQPLSRFSPGSGKPRTPRWRYLLAAGAAICGLTFGLGSPAFADNDSKNDASQRNERHDDARARQITLIQIGDLHGHMVPRPNLRSDVVFREGEMEGGLAHIYTLIKSIRAKDPAALLMNTGDTVQGSAEALYTRGQAMVDVLDRWGIDGYAFGNWDFLYGATRTFDLWGKGTGPGGKGHRWGGVAANCYCTQDFPGQCKTGELAFPPYIIKYVRGVKIGILGFTTQRGIPAMPFQTAGFRFTGAAPGGLPEMPHYIDVLRNQEHVDMIVMVSELGLGNNVYYAEKYPGVDVILSSDMHEITPRAVMTSTGTLVSEAGQDGTKVAEYHLTVKNGKVKLKDYRFHTITRAIPPDWRVAVQVAKIRAPFLSGPAFRPHPNPFNKTVLRTPVDKIVGETGVGLYRGNFSDENMPGVIEGSSHDFIADVFSDQTDADIGTIRGFRYGTHVRPGPITLEDLYHFISIGPQVASATIKGQQLKDQLEAGADGALSPDITTWSGGWLFGYSNVKYDLDAYKPKGSRVSNVRVRRHGSSSYEPLDLAADYRLAGYYFDQQPTAVGGFTPVAGSIQVHTGPNGKQLDGTDVVVDYLKTHDANPELNRITLLQPLPPPVYGNPEIQPLKGVPTLP